MKIACKMILASLAGLIFSIIVPAQEIPLLPQDNAISKGVLPNGMTWFIVNNPSSKGMADFALVGKDGHIRHLENVLLTSSVSVMDSTLLSLVREADKASPADHAIIVSGDVETASVAEKIKMLSYMTPIRDAAPVIPYEWKPVEGLKVVLLPSPERQLVTFRLTWRSPRIQHDIMNTIQPEITALFENQLGKVAGDRLELCLRQAGIPAVGIGYSHLRSDSHADDEQFSVQMSVAPEKMEPALKIMSYVMSSLDSGTATVQELDRAHTAYLGELRSAAFNPLKSNAEYVSRCVSAFLYNGSLASDEAVYSFHSSRKLDDKVELTLFNDIAAALLDKENNVTLECTSPQPVDADHIAGIFSSAWDMKSSIQWKDKPLASAFLAPAVPEKKMKIASAKKDPMSGGSVLTLENGMTVIIRNMPADGRIYYSLALNGGYSEISGLEEGEGAYIADYLWLCKVAGVSGNTFREALAAEDVTMDCKVGLTSTVISGSASRFDMSLVLQALSALTNEREQDMDEVNRYLNIHPLVAEALKGTCQDRMSDIDALMCPDYIYSGIKSSIALDEDFAVKAEKFFTTRFGKLNDGVLVITGDVSETELRKELALYGPGFRTAAKTVTRPSVRYQPVSGVSSREVEGDKSSIDMAMSARLPMTLDNYVASMVSSMVLEEKLDDFFEGTGWRPVVREQFTVYPDERFKVLVTLEEEEGRQPLDAVEAMRILRPALSRIVSEGISKDQLNACKEYLKGRMTVIQSDPAYWTEIISSRALFGKDLITDYRSRCDAVTAAKVQSIMSALDSAGKVEYTVTRK